MTTTSEPAFDGSIGQTVTDSTPWWPASGGPDNRSNVVMILLDDVGFGQVGCYGSDIRTPQIDALAGDGLRYTNFHVTPMCSPTRASLLTGRNHHSVGVGYLADFDTGYPGYRGRVTSHAATLAEMLGTAGYGCYAAGKWHLAPPDSLTAAGPFTHWPTGRGFDRWYGFLWGEDDQWHPELWEDQHRVAAERQHGQHLSTDLVDRSCAYLSDHVTGTPDRPFFLYLAFGACHAPHQAPQEYIDSYRGQFDTGWDQARQDQIERQQAMGIVPPDTTLASRNPDVPAWDSLSEDERRQCARLQEAFAGFMTHTDAQIGRLLQFLREQQLDENTLIILMSDNGASGEGGRLGSMNEYRYFLGLGENGPVGDADLDAVGSSRTHNHYPSGWAQAGNTPLKYYKKHTYGGGVRVPFIMRWPTGRPERTGAIKDQFHHAVDVVPTVLELTGTPWPHEFQGIEQIPLHGTSMTHRVDAASSSDRPGQYFEMGGHRGFYQDGWKAVTMHTVGEPFATDRWELYRLDDDFSEMHDLARQHPDRLAELQQAWWSAAREYGVLPLDDRAQARVFAGDPEHRRTRSHRLLPGSRLMSAATGLDFAARSFSIEGLVQNVTASTEGVILAHGRRAAGFTVYVQDSRLHFDYNLAGDHTRLTTPDGAVVGAHLLGLKVDMDADGNVHAVLTVDGSTCVRDSLPQLFPAGFGTFSTQCGHNAPSAVSDDYLAPFQFSGTLHRVEVCLGERDDTNVATLTAALRQQ